MLPGGALVDERWTARRDGCRDVGMVDPELGVPCRDGLDVGPLASVVVEGGQLGDAERIQLLGRVFRRGAGGEAGIADHRKLCPLARARSITEAGWWVLH